jgi:acetyl esterase
MTLHKGAKWVLDAIAAAEAGGRPPMEEMTPAQSRQLYSDSRAALTPAAPDMALVEDDVFPGAAGDVAIRYYRPLGSKPDERLPVMVFFHGGGWVIGDLDTHDVVCRTMSNAGAFAVISVDYRRGPEAKFPAAVDDAFAALKWTAQGAGGRAIDAARIAVCGDSAGGNLAAVAAIMARDAGGPALAFQGLIYPATNMNRDTQSHIDFAEGHLLTAKSQVWFQEQYLRGPADRDDWRASPLLCDDLSGLAPALVLTAGHDPLRDEGEAYAERLEDAGVGAEYSCYDGQIHGFITMGKVIDEAEGALNEVAMAAQAAFEPRHDD